MLPRCNTKFIVNGNPISRTICVFFFSSRRRHTRYWRDWSSDVCSSDLGARAAKLFGVTETGNFEGKSVLSLSRIPDEEERAFLRRVRPKLYEARAKRPPPLTDRKILTGWNGLMISAFARAGLALARPDFVERAARAADYLLRVHRPSARLARSSMDGVARHA